MRVSTLAGAIDIPDVEPRRPGPDEMIGLALDTLRTMPINGLRYLPESGGSGWYVWGGEDMRQTADFFSPVQVRYVSDYIATVVPFLDLPPGFRFLIDKGGRQKAWFDGSLLDV